MRSCTVSNDIHDIMTTRLDRNFSTLQQIYDQIKTAENIFALSGDSEHSQLLIGIRDKIQTVFNNNSEVYRFLESFDNVNE